MAISEGVADNDRENDQFQNNKWLYLIRIHLVAYTAAVSAHI